MDAKKKRRRVSGKPNGPRQKQKPEPKWKATVREIEEVGGRYESLDPSKVTHFSSLPLSTATRDGLKACGYTNPTDIQKEAIPLALRGKDVVGAAKTGSGKTLAFLIPLLELLWRERWSPMDGLGALVISPTRELAYQTFEVLRKVGACHDFSAGLVTGGKDITMEQDRIQKTNIVICTPGRLLQHMDETVDFDCSSLKMLVLDEADRILDLGFQHAVNAIIQNLPEQRQTLLFSATQTRCVRDLARLSLAEPEYVAVHEHSRHSTPHKLTQSYLVCGLQDKLNVLFSFVRNHLTCKMIVFISSCKQVKFVYEVFRRLRPGTPLMALYGRQKHVKRMAIYADFCRKKASVLFCTDIAARGLDIPAVDWVLQMDCPEDASTYIHRVGRTARYESCGKGLLFLLPSEEQGMVGELKRRKIPIECIQVNPRKVSSIQRRLESFCARDSEVKQWAQKSFICYLRSVHLQSNKGVFDVHKLSLDLYAASLGLLRPPRVRFMQKLAKRDTGGEEEEPGSGEESGSSEGEGEDSDSDDVEEEDSDQILFVKRVIPPGECDDAAGSQALDLPHETAEKSRLPVAAESQALHLSAKRPRLLTKPISRVTLAKKILNKKIKLNTHVKFDEAEDGGAHKVPSSLEEDSGVKEEDDGDSLAGKRPSGRKRKRGGASEQLGTDVTLFDDEEMAKHLLGIA